MDTATLKTIRDVLESVGHATSGGAPNRLGGVHLAHAAHSLIVAAGVNPEETLAHLRYLVDEHARAPEQVSA